MHKWAALKAIFISMINTTFGFVVKHTGYQLFLTVALILFSIVLLAQDSVYFEYTGSPQYFEVPPCVNSIEIITAGAKGGAVFGGLGTQVSGTFSVTPGDIFEIRVGGAGGAPDAGYNGGGLGGGLEQATAFGGGGGGATDVRMPPYFLNNRIIVAAGGGGGGVGGFGQTGSGGYGGCDTGGSGYGSITPVPMAEGGTQTEGGTGGWSFWYGGVSGEDGSFGMGGFGGSDTCGYSSNGGGGGGGLYGGGGGGTDCSAQFTWPASGGGGGSSLVPDGGTCEMGANSDDGYAIIAYTATPLAIDVDPEDISICEGTSVILTASGANLYTWHPPPGLSDTAGSSVIASPDFSQEYMIIGDDGFGCRDTAYINVDVHPHPDVSADPSAAGICQNDSIELNASGAESYSWSASGMTNIISGETMVVSPTLTTTYQLIGLNSFGCSDTAFAVVEILPTPTVDAGADLSICQNNTIELEGQVKQSDNFFWTPSVSLNDSDVLNPTASPQSTTTYILQASNQSSCSASDSVTVAVFYNNAEFNIEPVSGAPPMTVTFTNLSSSNSNIWNYWDFGNGHTTTDSDSILVHTYFEEGNYQITLITDIGLNCTDTAITYIEVFHPFSINIPNVFTPNNDGANDTFKPEITGVQSAEAEIYGRWGQQIERFNPLDRGWDGTNNGHPCSPGTYFYIIKLASQTGEEEVYKGSFTLLKD